MPKPGPSNPETPICPLCGQAGTDYHTSVLLNKGWQYLGHAEVDAHMECLIRAGGTFWQLDRMPQIQANGAFLATIRQWNQNVCMDHLITDLDQFHARFPDLDEETRTLTARLEQAGVDLTNTRSIWFGYYRPVDHLAELRQKWADLMATKPHLAYTQGTMFDPPADSPPAGQRPIGEAESQPMA